MMTMMARLLVLALLALLAVTTEARVFANANARAGASKLGASKISGKGGVSSQRKPNDVFMLDSMKPLSKEEAKAPKKTSLADYHGIELLGFFSP